MKRSVKSPAFPYIIIVVAYALMLLWGMLGGIKGDEIGYSVLCFNIFAPVAELLGGFFIGRRSVWYKWFFPLTGLLNPFIPFMVFGGRFIKAEFVLLTFIAVVPAIFGLVVGALYSKRSYTKDVDKMSAQDLE